MKPQPDTMLDRTIAPPIKDAIDFNLQLKPYNKFTLDNGIEVYAIDAGAEEVLQIEWVFFAGNWYEEQNMVAATTNYLLKNGTSKKTAFEINEHFDYYGSYLNRASYNETATISLHCLSKHTEHLLPVVSEIITDAVLPEDELQLYKQNNKQRLSVNLKKSEFVAGRLIDEYVFGIDHPYGKYSSAAAYDALQREQLLAAVQKTGRVLLLHEDCLTGGIGGEIAAWIAEHCFQYLDAPVLRCASLDTPIPFNTALEQNFMASARLEETIEKLLAY